MMLPQCLITGADHPKEEEFKLTNNTFLSKDRP